MKVAVVLMPYYRRESPAAELGMISGILKSEGHEVFLFDVNNGIFLKCFRARKYWRYLHLEPDSARDDAFLLETAHIFEYFVSEILNCNPDVIVFYSFGNTETHSNKMASLIKKKNCDIPIVFTGILHRDEEEKKCYILNQDRVPQDFTIIGYDEIGLPKLISCIINNKQVDPEFDKTFKRYGKIIDCSEGNFLNVLDLLPFFNFTNFNLNSYKFPYRLEIFTSRGCAWKCKFCTDWRIQGKYRSMSGKRIFSEFLHQLKLYKNLDHIRLVDLAINSNIEALSEFCDLMIESRENGMQKIYWSGDAIIHQGMTKELLLKMSKAGCGGIGYGLESGSESVVKAIGKHFSISIAEDVIRNTHIAGIKISINIITGFPTETQENFEQTINFIKRNKEYMDEIRLTFIGCKVRKNTDLSEHPEKFSIASYDADYWQTSDGENTFEERLKRFKRLTDLALSLKLELRLGGRILRKVQ